MCRCRSNQEQSQQGVLTTYEEDNQDTHMDYGHPCHGNDGIHNHIRKYL